MRCCPSPQVARPCTSGSVHAGNLRTMVSRTQGQRCVLGGPFTVLQLRQTGRLRPGDRRPEPSFNCQLAPSNTRSPAEHTQPRPPDLLPWESARQAPRSFRVTKHKIRCLTFLAGRDIVLGVDLRHPFRPTGSHFNEVCFYQNRKFQAGQECRIYRRRRSAPPRLIRGLRGRV